MEQVPYPTDGTDHDWPMSEPLLPGANKRGRPRKSTRRAGLEAVFYVRRTGCPWRGWPHDFPTGKTASHALRRWREDGTWKRRHERWREHRRAALGREAQPRAGLLDRQRVKTTGVGGERGSDGANQLKGRTRHLRVDPQGLVLAVTVHPAAVRDRDGVLR